MAKEINKVADGFNEILLYTTPNGKVKVVIYSQNETSWPTQQKVEKLFGVQRPAITNHLINIFEYGALQQDVVSSILEQTTQHGAMTEIIQMPIVKFHNLDAVISECYRVESSQILFQLTNCCS